jgi:hypothetical protein
MLWMSSYRSRSQSEKTGETERMKELMETTKEP